MPSPGGRTVPPGQPANNRHTTDSSSSGVKEIDQLSAAAGLNPLIAAANPLLNIVPQLRATLQHPDPSGLRDFIAQNIKAFESRAKAAGVTSEKVIAARYALCTLLDEAAASTPWGSGMWSKHSLLVMFHNEAWGGEKFFQLLGKLAENSGVNRDLLEFMYVCLALGFEGRYRVLENGKAHLDALRERLASLLKKERGEYERDLSARWQAAPVKRAKILVLLPVWVWTALCGLIMLTVYLSFSFMLNNASDPIFTKIQSIRQSIRVKNPIPEPIPLPAAEPRLAEFLVEEIREGLISVRDEDDRSVITLRGDGLFAPGSASISQSFLPVLERVAAALNSVPGQVRITGHTDDQPIRSARFPSNWHLSKERALSVMQVLTERGTLQGRVSAEGRAETEPIAPNDTQAGRMLNRRVEIILYVPPARS
ncbi:MAG: DotU family type VI secretion system protein [Nitrosospira sp.]